MEFKRVDSARFQDAKDLIKQPDVTNNTLIAMEFVKQCIMLDFFETYLNDLESRLVNEINVLGTSQLDKATAIVTLGLIKSGFESAASFAETSKVLFSGK